MKQLPFKQFREILGKLNYLTCSLRLDINFAVNYIARFMDNPGKAHWKALSYLLAYLREYSDAIIHFSDPSNITYELDGQVFHMERYII